MLSAPVLLLGMNTQQSMLQRANDKDDFIDDGTSEDTPVSSEDEGSDILMQDSDDSSKSWKPSKK